MISITIFLVFEFVLITRGSPLIEYHEPLCPPRLEFAEMDNTLIFLDLNINSEPEFKSCLLRNIHHTESILLLGGYYRHRSSYKQRFKSNDNPTVLIMTKNISEFMLDSPSIKQVIKSHRSIFFIFITDREKFICENGSLKAKDFLALQMFMNHFWLKYKIMRIIVTFPFSCKRKFAAYDKKIITDGILYNRSTKLVDISSNEALYALISEDYSLTEFYPLKANIFYSSPTSIAQCENLHYYTNVDLRITQGFCGLDALVMHDILKYFKFNLVFPSDKNCNKYGYKDGKNLSGVIGCIVRNELDISFNSRFMKMYSEDHIYYLYYVTTDSLCFVVKQADVVPLWYYVVNAYTTRVMLFIALVLVTIGLVMWATTAVNSKMNDKRRETFLFHLKDAVTSTMCGITLKTNTKLYILSSTCLFSSIIFVAIYQGHINHVFTTLSRYNIHTLDELYRSNKYMFISPSMNNIVNAMKSKENKLQDQFFKRAITRDDYSLDLVLKHPRAVTVGRQQDALTDTNLKFSNNYAVPSTHIIDECFYTFFLSYITRSGFPFYEELEIFMQRITEAGLPHIYHKWTCDMLGVPSAMPPKVRKESRPFNKLEIGDLLIAYSILIGGQLLSLLVLRAELSIAKHRDRRRRNRGRRHNSGHRGVVLN